MRFKEIKRILGLCCFEDDLSSIGYRMIAGVDEVGRGSLAGPLVAAAVILDRKKMLIEGINDSKKISEKKREHLYGAIISSCICWAVSEVEPAEIDKYNITRANIMAFERAIGNLRIKPDIILADHVNVKAGNSRSKGVYPAECLFIIKGDELSVSIAAASIIAKVTRDRIMRKMSAVYPEYGFDRNKGYGTRRHLLSLQKYGPTGIHRVSFKGVLN
ncbi:MAG: ribonuclease HII [Actinobacteria bacterium]|nr:ribonuclease HII [Actinomycetota bacterium]